MTHMKSVLIIYNVLVFNKLDNYIGFEKGVNAH